MDGQVWDAFQVAAAMEGPAQQFQRLLTRPDLVVGVLRVLPGGLDLQGTHQQDEVYACVGGHGLIRLGDRDAPVAPGSVIFVPAGLPHRFHGNKEQLTLAYVLAPAAAG
ncbi:MAG: cupin domain-containing protein [Armatimonadota bacterium]|nr:cupin domain-containing protein [Armatimonadota bacterium]MDR7534629.1 cupin domain-containing protein [Armatimonadota bacterium]